MNLKHIKDAELLSQIKSFVQSERDLLVKILHHLREIERRRLFADLGYKSLFDYAVGELRYSEGQAARRIQAMKVLKDLPEVETKIATGELSLSNIQQAQTFFRELQSAEPRRVIDPKEKRDVLAKLENKSVRQGQQELLRLSPEHALPKERERPVTETTTEVRFLMTDALKTKLEKVRSLLGPKGAMMSYAELFDAMSDLSFAALEAKHFGKKRAQEKPLEKAPEVAPASAKTVKKEALPPTPAPRSIGKQNPRYIPTGIKHQVWKRDKGVCVNCGSRRNLNYDHIKPVAHGGQSTVDNLRLLCFHCNQRASMKIFGEKYVKKKPA